LVEYHKMTKQYLKTKTRNQLKKLQESLDHTLYIKSLIIKSSDMKLIESEIRRKRNDIRIKKIELDAIGTTL
jgi:hypothetical protein